MNEVQEVAVLQVGVAADRGIPLSDWAIARLLDGCLGNLADWPASFSQDPSLARWMAARLPREASLTDLSACLDSMSRQKPIDIFPNGITAARLNGDSWHAFQQWWRFEAAVVRCVQGELRDDGLAPLIPVLSHLIGTSPLPAGGNSGMRPFALVTSCATDDDVVRSIENAQRRLRSDSQLVQDCLSAEQRNRVDSALNPLHRLAPELLRSLIELRDLRDKFDERLEHEKLLSMKELAYGASHEINNPLANISSRAQVLMRDESDPERRRGLATINSQAFRAHEMIADMMLFAKPPALTLSRLAPKPFMDTLVEQIKREIPGSIQLRREDAEEISAELIADATQLTVAIQAICTNAVEAMDGHGQLVLRLRQAPVNWQHEAVVEIEIQDDGPGISPEVRRHLFDPFYSGREAGRGLGFGLSKAWRIVHLHGGQIFVQSQAGEGATFTLSLPASES